MTTALLSHAPATNRLTTRRATSAGQTEFVDSELSPTSPTRMAATDWPAAEFAEESVNREYGLRLLAVARRFLRSEEDAADAVQEAFLSAFAAFGTFKRECELSTWLYRILVNVCLMKLRARRSQTTVSLDELLPKFDESGRHAAAVQSWSSGADELAQREETRRFVRKCIERLPDAYRAVVLLRDIEQLDTSEAAAMLQISPCAVKTRLHRARQALRMLLEPLVQSGRPTESTSHCNRAAAIASNQVST